MQCPSCAAVVPAQSRFCLTCGQPLAPPSDQATIAAPPAAVAMVGPHARRLSSDAVPVGGFTPGVILADRYRIIGLLGRGGMGEVYRADDLKLGQPVALKFLPRALAADPVQRERFFAEVRITRQLSHPNICRVYDVAEVNGQHFLSMEYIDGEDLASLLQRIGYLANEKALDIARQLVAGIAAAHERGVLHRDLKPANVMLDGRGRVRITDFGLAVAVADEAQSAEISGTPAYMAPEQLAGKGATVRSDVYALGLVLYELYTGTRAFQARTLAELREQKDTLDPASPSELRPGIDPVVERAIARCLERDPRQRPASAAQVAASLPGGDPLAAAIAAGETPSPEMVAASGGAGQLPPIVGVCLLAVAAVAAAALVAMMSRSYLPLRLPLALPPAVLANEAREILESIGYDSPSGDSAFGLEYDDDYIGYIRQTAAGPAPWDRLDSRAIYLWYRESARPLEHGLFAGRARVAESDPPLTYAGDALVRVDSEGRLRRLEVLAPQAIPGDTAARDVEWSRVFAAAGLDIAQWRAIAPRWNPLHYGDARAAWEGRLPPFGVPARIEAAAYGGKPVWFDIVLPTARPEREPGSALSPPAAGFATLVALVTFATGSLVFARRNLRMGRGDRRGATRLAAINLGLGAVTWVLRQHHVGTLGELRSLMFAASLFLLTSSIAWLAYVAFEPFVRRQMPLVLVSWTRLLAGNWRDPLVGRDILIGGTAGVLGACLGQLEYFLPPLLGQAGGFLRRPDPTGWSGTLGFLEQAIRQIYAIGFALPLFYLFFLFVVRLLIRNTWVAAAVAALVLVPVVWGQSLQSLAGSSPWTILPVVLAGTVFMLSVLIRFGFLALAALGYVMTLLASFPLTFAASSWYAGYGYAALGVVAALLAFGFRMSRAPRPSTPASL